MAPQTVAIRAYRAAGALAILAAVSYQVAKGLESSHWSPADYPRRVGAADRPRRFRRIEPQPGRPTAPLRRALGRQNPGHQTSRQVPGKRSSVGSLENRRHYLRLHPPPVNTVIAALKGRQGNAQQTYLRGSSAQRPEIDGL